MLGPIDFIVCGEVYEAVGVDSSPVVSRCKPADMLEVAEDSLYPVVVLVDGGVVRDEDLTI